MNSTSRNRCLACLTSAVLLLGCGKQPNAKDAASKVKLGADVADETLATATKALARATEVNHYREGLKLFNSYVDKSGATIPELKKETAAAMSRLFALDEDQLSALRGGRFKAQDAFHVEGSFLFRDAARFVEVPGLSRAEQSAHALAWVCRHINLYEQLDADLPPAFVVKRGFGGTMDRALAFIEILTQLGISSCLVTAENSEGPAPLLVGVCLKDKPGSTFALFDPRRGEMVRGAEGGPATIGDLLKNPDQFRSLGLPADAKKIQLRLACALLALAPRTGFLEDKLRDHQRIVLYQDLPALVADLESTSGLTLSPWGKATRDGVIPPLRLATLVPAEEIEKNARLQGFDYERVAWRRVVDRLAEMRILGEIPELAQDALLRRVHEVFGKFLLQPQNMLAHGKPDDALRRVYRIRRAFDDLDTSGLDEGKLADNVAAWRDKVNEAYAALGRKEKGAEAKVAAVWAADKYLASLLDLDSDEFDPAKNPKGTLSYILLRSCRQPLGKDVTYLHALALHDKAERQQALLDSARAAKKDSKSLRKAAEEAWASAAYAWKGYQHYLVGPEVLAARVPIIRSRWEKDDKGLAISELETLQHELHRSVAAGFLSAAVDRRRGNAKEAETKWETLRGLVKAAQADRRLAEVLPQWAKEAPPAAHRLDMLARDWTPAGAWAHWAEVVRGEP